MLHPVFVLSNIQCEHKTNPSNLNSLEFEMALIDEMS